ncbi:CYTH domain-containing protein [Microbacterium sp. P05]|uniref:CYTH domain-containing protein n=1 Tax=Microbacterium sp. P05 TaxID=3366948 RepID=UPI0037457CD3
MTHASSSEPHRSLEIERKYDVSDATPLPDWDALPGVVSVSPAEVRELDARYFDTDRLDLARAGVAVRRREGGPDAGWHVKASATGGRSEWGWPLDTRSPEDDPDAAVPGVIAEAVAQWAGPPFLPLARIRNTRTAYALLDRDGGLVAEFVDDRVTGWDERGGSQTSWREWEVELGPAAPDSETEREQLFAAVDAAVTAAGGGPAASDSKLGRVLGH